MKQRARQVLLAIAVMLCSVHWPHMASAYELENRRPYFDRPELGLSMSLSPGGLFGLLGGSLLIAPLRWLVIEPGIAQRLRGTPRPVGLVRARFVRFSNMALSIGVGLDRHESYVSRSFDCFLDDRGECGRYARNVWGAPLQLALEARLRSGFTVGPHLGFRVPLAWDQCRVYEAGERVGSCVPLLRPYVGVTVSWSALLGRSNSRVSSHTTEVSK